jgi:SHS2 domain-containing protein
MPYRFLEDIATADVAFEAWGKTPEELFAAAADALMNVMVAELQTIRPREEVELRLEHEALDLLLFNFLNEFVYYKDARLLLLRVKSITIKEPDERYLLHATVSGEQLDPSRHAQLVDVKAVTLHRFHVEKTEEGWRAEVVLDV